MTDRPYILAESHWKTVDATAYTLAVLPWGSTEAHNYHLPYGTDSIEAEHCAIAAAERAWREGARVMVLPTIPFGVQTTQLDIKGCINMNPSTQLAVLVDVAHSLATQGIHKLCIMNGHGGNDFKPLIRELQPRTPVFLSSVDWWKVADGKLHFDEPGDHGGELETSVVMHLAPDLVRPLGEAGPGREHRFRNPAFREGWAWAPRQWRRITADTGVGDPTRATAEKGARFFDVIIAKITTFFIELARADLNDLYE